MMKKNNYFTCFIFFCRFPLLVCGEKNILANLTNSQEPEPVGAGAGRSRVFLAPWSRSRSSLKKNRSRSRLGKKIRSRSRLKKKSGAGAGKKFAGSPAMAALYTISIYFLHFSLSRFHLMYIMKPENKALSVYSSTRPRCPTTTCRACRRPCRSQADPSSRSKPGSRKIIEFHRSIKKRFR